MILFTIAIASPLFAASALAIFDTIHRRRDRRLSDAIIRAFHERDTLPSIDDERPTLPTLETEREQALARFKP
jgi:hypothetical protein